MDSTTIIILIALIIVAGIFFLRRPRPAAPRAYDDPKVRSGGSSGDGSSGGGAQVYDSPVHTNEGSVADQSKLRRASRADDIEEEPEEGDSKDVEKARIE